MTISAGPACHGYRVVDLADETAALCGKMFADLGADVVKVEPPGGCPTRSIPPFLDEGTGPDRSLYFQALAAGKRSVTLDLQRPEGRDLLARLADGADFLVESSPPGYLDQLGLSYQALAARNPRLIYTSVEAVRRWRAGCGVARRRHRRLGRERDDDADGRAGAAAAAGQCPAGLLLRGRGGGRREHAGAPGPRAVRTGPAGRDQPAGRGGRGLEHRDGVSRPGGALDGPQRPHPGLHAAGPAGTCTRAPTAMSSSPSTPASSWPPPSACWSGRRSSGRCPSRSPRSTSPGGRRTGSALRTRSSSPR